MSFDLAVNCCRFPIGQGSYHHVGTRLFLTRRSNRYLLSHPTSGDKSVWFLSWLEFLLFLRHNFLAFILIPLACAFSWKFAPDILEFHSCHEYSKRLEKQKEGLQQDYLEDFYNNNTGFSNEDDDVSIDSASGSESERYNSSDTELSA
jgi:hypothetical protein